MKQFTGLVVLVIVLVGFVTTMLFIIQAQQAQREAIEQSRQTSEAAKAEIEASLRTAQATMRETEELLERLQENVTRHAGPIESANPHGDSALADFTFLVGTWRGEKDGEFVEEIWSAPRGGAMMGTFRWLNAEEQSRMYELLTITREDDDVFLRLRHFTRAMHAWEEKDEPVVLKLADMKPHHAVFENVNPDDRMARIEFYRIERGRLAIDVIFHEGHEIESLAFRFERANRFVPVD